MRLTVIIFLLALFPSTILSANSVTGLSASYKNGQVFFTWTNLSSPGVEYRLYKSSDPINYGTQLSAAQYLGSVYDSSSYNKHLSQVQAQFYYLKIDSSALPLLPNAGLFVATSVQNGSFYYALTTVVGGVEDTTIDMGENSLSSPITELIKLPKPVHQVKLTINSKEVDVYVLYTSLTATSIFPQMVNVGSYPFNFSVVRNGTISPHPLVVKMSGGGSSFLSGIVSGLEPQEYRIGVDDWLPNGERSTWFGFNEGYNILSHQNSPPVLGVNRDYSFKRLQYTVEWATHNLPVDSNRVYFQGASAGASGAFLASLLSPLPIAATSLNVPKFDLSFLEDPDTSNNYNTGHQGRLRVDTLFGTVSTNLLTNLGPATYDLLNGGWLAHQHADDEVPLIFSISGKKDTMVGWAEKIAYFDSVNSNRLGGYYFWDMRKHNGDNGYWVSSFDLFRYSSGVSFPAFSNCSTNGNPGEGTAESGDSVGTINGFLDWKDEITDNTDFYEIAIYMHNIPTVSASVIAPDSCLTDITLRRLQNFSIPSVPNTLVEWKVFHDGNLVQKDSFVYEGGLITLEGVKIFKDTSIIQVTFSVPDAVSMAVSSNEISIYPNPASDHLTICCLQESTLPAEILITDVSGHELNRFIANTSDFDHEIASFSPGLYFVRIGSSVKAFVKF